MISREEIQNKINDGTFFEYLLSKVKIDKMVVKDVESSNERQAIRIKFPKWYDLYIEDSSREYIEEKVKMVVNEMYNN